MSQPKDGDLIGPFGNERIKLDIPRFPKWYDTAKFGLFVPKLERWYFRLFQANWM